MPHIPVELATNLAGYQLHSVDGGESGALVYRCTSDGRPTLYLKVAPVNHGHQLDREAARLDWLKVHGIATPASHAYVAVRRREYLLVDEVPGTPASDSQWLVDPLSAVVALGEALAVLHATSIAACPFDQRIASQLERARQRVAAGLVDEDDFDDTRRGRSAAELLSELAQSTPPVEDLVLTHGDFCLPNIMLDRTADGNVRVSGLIDCGRVGVADRYQDLALAVRSLEYNVGPEWIQVFADSYGQGALDQRKIAFYQLLDEFF